MGRATSGLGGVILSAKKGEAAAREVGPTGEVSTRMRKQTGARQSIDAWLEVPGGEKADWRVVLVFPTNT